MRILCLFGTITCLFFIFTVPLLSQKEEDIKLWGAVIDEKTEMPIEGVTVNLSFTKSSARQSFLLLTDKNGKWNASKLQPGTWNLRFEKVGYLTKIANYSLLAQPKSPQSEIIMKLYKIENLEVTEDISKVILTGNQLFLEKRYDDAKSLCLKALDKHPHLYILNKYIGDCNFENKNYEAALQNYLTVYENQNDMVDIIAAIAQTYVYLGDYEKALNWFLKVPFDQVSNDIAYYNIGLLLFNTGQLGQAARYLSEAIKIDPQFADAQFKIGITYRGLGKYDESLEALKKFLELAPNSPQAETAKAIIEDILKKKY